MRTLETEIIAQLSTSLAVAYALADGKTAATESREAIDARRARILKEHQEMAERALSVV